MGQVSLKGKDLLGLQHVSKEEIELILRVAKKMKKIDWTEIDGLVASQIGRAHV